MGDEREAREKYAEFLGEDASAVRLRLIKDLEALGAATRPPQHLVSSMRARLRERKIAGTDMSGDDSSRWGRSVNKDSEEIMRTEDRRHAQQAPSGWGRLVGLAAFSLVVAIIAVGLSTMLSRLDGGTRSAVRESRDAASVRRSVGAAPSDVDISPLLLGEGVLHIKGTISWQSYNGEITEQFETEFWYDRANGDARFHIKNVSGIKGYDLVCLRQGSTYTFYDVYSGALHTKTETADNTYAGPKPVEAMFHLEPTIIPNWGLIEPVGEEVVDGKKVIKFVVKADKRPILFVDKETRLPLKRLNLSWSSKDLQRKIHGNQVHEYPLIETVDRASLTGDFFSPAGLQHGPTPVPRAYPTIPGPTPGPNGPTPEISIGTESTPTR